LDSFLLHFSSETGLTVDVRETKVGVAILEWEEDFDEADDDVLV
jgi:hypothetical protein